MVPCFAILLGLCLILAALWGYSNEPKPSAGPPKTAQQIEDGKYESAVGACMLWAEKNGPLLMGDLVDDYQLPRRKQDPKDVYRAGLHYRAKPSGLLMRADCSTLHMKDGRIMILEAKARPGQ
jgi:hypothetical protein